MNGVSEFAFLSTLSFLFGVTQKLADGRHEHGLDFFPGAGLVFGVFVSKSTLEFPLYGVLYVFLGHIALDPA
jgi:hypothetical protein